MEIEKKNTDYIVKHSKFPGKKYILCNIVDMPENSLIELKKIDAVTSPKHGFCIIVSVWVSDPEEKVKPKYIDIIWPLNMASSCLDL